MSENAQVAGCLIGIILACFALAGITVALWSFAWQVGLIFICVVLVVAVATVLVAMLNS